MVNGLYSAWRLVRSGVLQGPILRLVLLNVFISNLEVATKGILIKLADDIKVEGIADMLKGRLSTEGTHTGWGMGQKEPYENQQGQMPSPAPGRLWAGDCLPGWNVALQKKALGFVSDSELGMSQQWASSLTLVWADGWASDLLRSPPVRTILLSSHSEMNLTCKMNSWEIHDLFVLLPYRSENCGYWYLPCAELVKPLHLTNILIKALEQLLIYFHMCSGEPWISQTQQWSWGHIWHLQITAHLKRKSIAYHRRSKGEKTNNWMHSVRMSSTLANSSYIILDKAYSFMIICRFVI